MALAKWYLSQRNKPRFCTENTKTPDALHDLIHYSNDLIHSERGASRQDLCELFLYFDLPDSVCPSEIREMWTWVPPELEKSRKPDLR
jgi:hypothetical protein